MISKEGAIRRFVEHYDMEVPPDLVEEEFQISLMDMRHRMVYAGMSGDPQLNPLEQQTQQK